MAGKLLEQMRHNRSHLLHELRPRERVGSQHCRVESTSLTLVLCQQCAHHLHTLNGREHAHSGSVHAQGGATVLRRHAAASPRSPLHTGAYRPCRLSTVCHRIQSRVGRRVVALARRPQQRCHRGEHHLQVQRVVAERPV